jgi:hypothetical protein
VALCGAYFWPPDWIAMLIPGVTAYRVRFAQEIEDLVSR